MYKQYDNFPNVSYYRQLNNQLFNLRWETNWSKNIISLDEIVFVKDRDDIPSIDNPKFTSIYNAKTWLTDQEPVIVVDINGEQRAYPLQILMWHEIVNDVIGNDSIAVTYCPLCSSAFVFKRKVADDILEFGTSGLLRNSNLIMYDRKTETLWQQFTGKAIVGDLIGYNLQFIPSGVVSFKDFYTSYPNGKVLSRNTGYNRNYGLNPYVGYDTIGNTPTLFKGSMDTRLPAMLRVVGVWGDVFAKAYPFDTLVNQGVINDKYAGIDYVILFKEGTNSALNSAIIGEGNDVGASGVFIPYVEGMKLEFKKINGEFKDVQTGSIWTILGKAVAGPLKGKQLTPIDHGDVFWFAWAAFYPDSEIFQNNNI